MPMLCEPGMTRDCSAHKVEASARAMAQPVPMVCGIVYRSSIRHLPRLAETSRRIEERLDVEVCEPSVREPCASGGTCLENHQHQRALGTRGCLDHHRHTPCAAGGDWLKQHRHLRGFGAPRCLEQSTIKLVLLEAPVWHTSGALLRADASTSIGSCLVCLGEPR